MLHRNPQDLPHDIEELQVWLAKMSGSEPVQNASSMGFMPVQSYVKDIV